MWENKKKRRILAAAVILAVCVSAALLIFISPRETRPEQATGGVLIDMMTGEASEYSLDILRVHEIENDFAREWAEGIISDDISGGSEGYYTLYNSSGEVMDMYLLSPAINKLTGDIYVSNVTVTVSGTALIISVETNGETNAEPGTEDTGDSALVFHITAIGPPESATAKSDLLIVNGQRYNYISSTFKALG
jgi:hypothetical protein